MSPDLEALTHRLATVELYEFLQGTNAWRYTLSDQTEMHLGNEYVPLEASRKRIQESQEDDSGQLQITLPANNPVALLFVGYLPPAPLALRAYSGQRQDLGRDTLFAGSVESAEFKGATVELTCVSQSALLQRSLPCCYYQSGCNHVLFGAGCALSASEWRDEGLILAVDGAELTISTPVTREDGYYSGGRILTPSGESRRIISQAANRFALSAPLRTAALGDALSLWPGCDHTEATCREKFDNVINFLGFSRMSKRNPFLSSY